MKNKIIKTAALHAFLTALYIAAISSFMFYGPKNFGSDKADTVLMPIVMLSLLVFSAALTGMLVFARPVAWYLDGKKKEAFSLLGYTLGIFLIFILIAFFFLYQYLVSA